MKENEEGDSYEPYENISASPDKRSKGHRKSDPSLQD